MNSPALLPSATRKTSIVAVLSLVLALMTLPGVFCCAGFVTGTVSVVLGIIGLIQVKNGEASQTSKVLSLAGIVVSTLAMVGYILYAALFVGMAAFKPDAFEKLGPDQASQHLSSRASQTAEAPTLVPLDKLLNEYKDNEVRADAEYKGKLIQTSGIVGDVKKDILGSPYVTVGHGRTVEIPEVQCFVKDAKQAAAFDKGQHVTVVGRVDGLMMNVLVKKCVLSP